MEDSIAIKLAVQGNGSVTFNVAEYTTVGELKELAQMNPHLEIRINGEPVNDDRVVENGETVIATQAVKGGIS
jgi:hypothetical protein